MSRKAIVLFCALALALSWGIQFAQLAAYNFPQHPILGAVVLFPLQLVGAAFFLGWLTIRARSFWPAALAHGATNSIQEGVLSNFHLAVPHIYEDVARTAIGVVVGLICWAALSAKRE